MVAPAFLLPPRPPGAAGGPRPGAVRRGARPGRAFAASWRGAASPGREPARRPSSFAPDGDDVGRRSDQHHVPVARPARRTGADVGREHHPRGPECARPPSASRSPEEGEEVYLPVLAGRGGEDRSNPRGPVRGSRCRTASWRKASPTLVDDPRRCSPCCSCCSPRPWSSPTGWPAAWCAPSPSWRAPPHGRLVGDG